MILTLLFMVCFGPLALAMALPIAKAVVLLLTGPSAVLWAVALAVGLSLALVVAKVMHRVEELFTYYIVGLVLVGFWTFVLAGMTEFWSVMLAVVITLLACCILGSYWHLNRHKTDIVANIVTNITFTAVTIVMIMAVAWYSTGTLVGAGLLAWTLIGTSLIPLLSINTCEKEFESFPMGVAEVAAWLVPLAGVWTLAWALTGSVAGTWAFALVLTVLLFMFYPVCAIFIFPSMALPAAIPAGPRAMLVALFPTLVFFGWGMTMVTTIDMTKTWVDTKLKKQKYTLWERICLVTVSLFLGVSLGWFLYQLVPLFYIDLSFGLGVT